VTSCLLREALATKTYLQKPSSIASNDDILFKDLLFITKPILHLVALHVLYT
jgi:hypothetical protein